MFANLLNPPLPKAIKDISNNDHYAPKQDIVDNWTVLVEKDEKDLFVLRFAYQLKADLDAQEKWLKLKLWSLECAVAQGDYVVIDLEKNEDRVTIILHEYEHPFDKNQCEIGSPLAGPLNLAREFSDYACNAPWTGKRLGRLLNNITKVNGALQEAKKGKEKKKPSSASQSKRVPKPVPETSRPSQSGASRGSRQTGKRSHSQMESSGVTEGPDVSSELTVAPLLKRGQRPDAELSTKMFKEFDEKTRGCWPLGRLFTFDVDVYKCHPGTESMNTRTKEESGVYWQMNNIMNNPKFDRQTICVTPKDPVVDVTEENWPIIREGEFYIVDGQHSIAAAKALLENDSWQNPLKESIRYWKAFLVHSTDTNQLIAISAFLNQGNKVRQFEASWVANIVAGRKLWEEHGCPPKERENAVRKNPKWHAFSSAIVTKFASIDMRVQKKTVADLKGELKLITASGETWATWMRLFDQHSKGELVNPETETMYKSDPKLKIPALLREFFRPIQGLTDSELCRAAQHILLETPRRALPYPKIWIKKPKHNKPSTYGIKDWCDHRKKKTMAVKELAKLLPEYFIINTDGDIVWENWRKVKEEYHINGVSMRALVRHASSFLAQRSRKNEKKGDIDDQHLYVHFLDRKKRATFGGVARLNTVDNKMIFGRWDSHASRATVREDRRGSPFAVFDFRTFPGAWKEPQGGRPFYEPFFGAFKAYRSPALFEPNVWLWIVEQEKSASIVALYHEKMSTDYILYHSTYIPATTEGLYIIQEAQGFAKPGAVSLYFLTHKKSPSGRPPVKASVAFRKIYEQAEPHEKDLIEETLYTIYPARELRMEFYVGILKTLCSTGDTIYNVFGGTKLMYAALVSVPV